LSTSGMKGGREGLDFRRNQEKTESQSKVSAGTRDPKENKPTESCAKIRKTDVFAKIASRKYEAASNGQI